MILSLIIMINTYNAEELQMLIPLLIIILMGGVFFFKLYNIEKELPIFDIGAVLVLVTIIYSIYPLIALWLSNFEWGVLSDNRLRNMNPGPVEIGSFTYNHIIYIFGICSSYLLLRRNDQPSRYRIKKTQIQKRDLYIIVILYLFLQLWALTFNYFGFYPHFIMQLNNMFAGTTFAITIILICFAFSKWNQLQWKGMIFLFIGYELIKLFLGLSGRTWVFMHLFAVIMCYHHYVKPFSFTRSSLMFAIALAMFMVAGFNKAGNFLQYAGEYSLWTASNEFMSMLGTPYDLHHRLNIEKSLYEIPLSLLFNDIIFLVPSQLLPFYKHDLSLWYLEVIGFSGKGVGFMFGVISQSIIGGGKIELLIRGIFLGVSASFLHKFFIKNSKSIWLVGLYVFLSIKCYYTFRASTGFIFYFLIYQFGSAYILTKIGSNLIWPFKKQVII